MSLQRGATSTSVIDVLDRVLDKGIVIDAWMRVSLVGIDLITVEARVIVASIATYLNSADAIAQCGPFLPSSPHSSLDTRRSSGGPDRRPQRRIGRRGALPRP
jgi:hypothetical protein